MYIANKIETFYPARRGWQRLSRLLFTVCLLFAINAALPSVCLAANHYIRDGASGDGSDWTNAWDDLPASLTRGDTYYIADGTYGGHTFNDSVDGEKYIYIKKAIESDHGTDTGWQSSYGDGTADFVMEDNDERLIFLSSYYVLDGQVGGGPGSWDSGHGFRFILGEGVDTSDYRGVVGFGRWSTYLADSDFIEIRHAEFTSPYRGDYDGDFAIYHYVVENDEDGGPLHITISHCYLHDFCMMIQVKQGRYWTVEYNHFARNNGGAPGSGQEGQSEAWQDFGTDDVIVRYNIFEDIIGTAFIALKSGISGTPFPCNNWEIYGNVFYYTSGFDGIGLGGNGVIGDTGNEGGPTVYTSNMKVYNNAFVNIFGLNTGIYFKAPLSQNNKVYNNIWYNCVSRAGYPLFTGVDDHDYNWYHNVVIDGVNRDSTLAGDESNGQVGTGDPFTDSESGNFTLAAGTVAGHNLGSPYNVDMLGNTRGADGVWDRGAYEYILSDSNNTVPVLQAIGNKSVNENSTLSFSVSATDADGDTITYSATGSPTGATFSSPFTWTPSYDQAGTYNVTFTASDGQAQDSETITITVNNTNRAPVLEAIGNKSVSENGTLSFSVSAADADGDTITYSVQSLPSGAVFAGQTFTWTPGYSQAGTHQVTFIAGDGQAQDTEAITITVNNVNRDPVLSSIGNKSVYTENSLSFTISATDPDGDTITYTAAGLPGGATFSGQSFSWTPSNSQAGSYNVTFTASDSQAQDSETITITVTADSSAPTVSNLSPAADSIQEPLNSLIYLDITDSGKGVNASTVTIEVNGNLVYTGNTTDYSSSYGHCRRIGTRTAYKYIYQTDEMFDYGQTVTVTVNATDLAANPMDEYSYSFKTEMRSFGENKKVNSNSNILDDGSAATVSDSSGNIWAVWHTGQTGSRDIYIGKLTAGADSFGSSAQVTNDNTDQCNPVIAIDSADKLYIAWQDSRNGEWDIYLSTSTDGTNFSAATKITDPNSNQTNPAIVIDSSNKAYIVFEDDRNNNKDIYIASSSNSFVSKTTSQITSNASNQTAPAIAADSGNTVYVVWTDARGSSNDIYGAASNAFWANVAVVSNANNQSSPAIATEASGTILHLLWVDDTLGDNDIYYASSNGLPSSSLSGSSLIDDSSGADQSAPAITTTGSTGNDLKVFACWKDERNVSSGNGDTDIYFVEVNSGSGTNVLAGDDSTNSAQSYPAMGVDGYGYSYLVWTDNRNTNTDIYYAGHTFVESTALESEDVVASSGATVGTELASISSAMDVSVTIPAGACSHDVTITISSVKNPQKVVIDRFSTPFEFGPSGMEFDEPVTIIIPYEVSTVDGSPSAYWYNSLTGIVSQQGITNIETIEISSTLHALRFKTTHFTQFLIGGGIVAVAGGGGGGGGCSMSPGGRGSMVEFLLPYIGLTVGMTILKLRDRRKKKAYGIT